jgi:Na+/melibiose symporter-like transporter
MSFHRASSAIFGLAVALAGLEASGYIQTDFKGDTLLSATAGILVPGVLMLSAFYMAFRFLKFAATGKKQP